MHSENRRPETLVASPYSGRSGRWTLSVILLTVLFVPPGARSQLEPLGARQAVGFGERGRLAVDPRGRFGIIWMGRVTLSFPAVMFDAEGHSTRGLFRVRDQTPDRELRPGAIAVDGAGDYLVAWTSSKLSGGSGSVQVRFFDALGKPRSRQFEIEPLFENGDYVLGSAARNRAGDAVLVWSRRDFTTRSVLRAQRFDRRNRPVGGPIDVRAGQLGVPFDFTHWQVAIDDLGRFVVVWKQVRADGEPVSRYLFQRFRRDGVKLGKPRLVSRDPRNVPLGAEAAVAREPSGDFAVGWLEGGVMVRFYDEFGRPLSRRMMVSEGPAVFRPAIARDRFGNAIVLWAVSESDFFLPATIYARVYDRSGEPRGETVEVGSGFDYSVGVDDDGEAVVAWTDIIGPHSTQFFRRFRMTCVPGYEQRCSE